MKKQLKSPPMLTVQDRIDLKKYLFIDDWQFEVLFLERCVEISSFVIRRDSEKTLQAKVYGLMARYKENDKRCIANIFIRFDCRVYRVYDIAQAVELVELLRKEEAYSAFMKTRRELRHAEKEKKKKIRLLKAA